MTGACRRFAFEAQPTTPDRRRPYVGSVASIDPDDAIDSVDPGSRTDRSHSIAGGR